MTATPLPAALLHLHGPQALDLLQAQTTQELLSLGDTELRAAAICTPQGRVIADFLVWRDSAGGVALLPDPSLAEALLRRLRMFILRLQCQIESCGAARQVFGLLLAADDAAAGLAPLESLGLSCPEPGTLQRAPGLCLLRLPDAPGQLRLLLVAQAGVTLPDLAVASPQEWELAGIRAGVGRVSAMTTQQFVPQMLNYELLGAVDFKKGCYPGQEVVARTQYRGGIRRRTYRVVSAVALQAGDELFHSADPGQPCGMVVNAAPAGSTWEALAELKIAATQSGTLHLRGADGAPLQLATLPYALPAQD